MHARRRARPMASVIRLSPAPGEGSNVGVRLRVLRGYSIALFESTNTRIRDELIARTIAAAQPV
jgi:hypothetical protein